MSTIVAVQQQALNMPDFLIRPFYSLHHSGRVGRVLEHGLEHVLGHVPGQTPGRTPNSSFNTHFVRKGAQFLVRNVAVFPSGVKSHALL